LPRHDPRGGLASGRIRPVAVDAERLDVDGLLIRRLEARRSEHTAAATTAATRVRELRAFDDLGNVDDAVTVDVDHLHALPPDEHFAARGGRLKIDAGRRARQR